MADYVKKEASKLAGPASEPLSKNTQHLLDEHGNKVPVPVDQIPQKVAEGHSGPVLMDFGPEVGVKAIPANLVDQMQREGATIANQSSLPSMEQQAERHVRQHLDEEYTAQAYGDAAIASLTFGASEAFKTEEQRAKTKAVAEANPYATMAGQATGMVATFAAGSGALTAIRSAATTARAASAGRAVRSGNLLAELGLEATASVQLSVADAAIHNKELTAESVMANLGPDILVGMGVYGAFAGAKHLTKGAINRLGKTRIGRQVQQHIEDAGNVTPGPKTEAHRLDEEMIAKFKDPEFLKQALGDEPLQPGIKGHMQVARAKLEGIDPKLKLLYQKHAPRIATLDNEFTAVSKGIKQNFDELRNLDTQIKDRWNTLKNDLDFTGMADDALPKARSTLSTLADSLEASARTANTTTAKEFRRVASILRKDSSKALTDPNIALKNLQRIASEDLGKSTLYEINNGARKQLEGFIRDEQVWGDAGKALRHGNSGIAKSIDFYNKFARTTLGLSDDVADVGKRTVSVSKVTNAIKRAQKGEKFVSTQKSNLDELRKVLDELDATGDRQIQAITAKSRAKIDEAQASLQAALGDTENLGPLALKTIQDSFEQQIKHAEAAGGSLFDRGASVVLGSLGWMTMGPFGGAMGHVAGRMIRKARSFATSSGVLQSTASTVHNTIRPGAVTFAANARLGAFTPISSISRASMLVHHLNATEESKRKEFEPIHAYLNDIGTNPELFINNLQAHVEPFMDYDEETANHISHGAASAMYHLMEHLPRGTVNLRGEDLSTISSSEIDEFMERVYAMQNPSSVVDAMNTGTLGPEAAETFRFVYPQLYAELLNSTIDNLAELEEVPLAHLTMVNTLAGFPVDDIFSWEMGEVLHQKGAQTQAQDGAMFGTQAPRPPSQHSTRQLPMADQHRTISTTLAGKT